MENSPQLARPDPLGGWRLRMLPSREPGARGEDKRGLVGKGCRGVLEERRGHRAGRPAALAFLHPRGTVEGPEARGRGNRMRRDQPHGSLSPTSPRSPGVLEGSAAWFGPLWGRQAPALAHRWLPRSPALAAVSQLRGSRGAEGAPLGPHLPEAFSEADFVFLFPSRKKSKKNYFKENARAAKSQHLLLERVPGPWLRAGCCLGLASRLPVELGPG